MRFTLGGPNRPTFSNKPSDHNRERQVKNRLFDLGGWTIVMHGHCETRDHENGKRKPKPFGQEYSGDLENRHVLLTCIDELKCSTSLIGREADPDKSGNNRHRDDQPPERQPNGGRPQGMIPERLDR
jgi:hypothetical protein